MTVTALTSKFNSISGDSDSASHGLCRWPVVAATDPGIDEDPESDAEDPLCHVEEKVDMEERFGTG